MLIYRAFLTRRFVVTRRCSFFSLALSLISTAHESSKTSEQILWLYKQRHKSFRNVPLDDFSLSRAHTQTLRTLVRCQFQLFLSSIIQFIVSFTGHRVNIRFMLLKIDKKKSHQLKSLGCSRWWLQFLISLQSSCQNSGQNDRRESTRSHEWNQISDKRSFATAHEVKWKSLVDP